MVRVVLSLPGFVSSLYLFLMVARKKRFSSQSIFYSLDVLAGWLAGLLFIEQAEAIDLRHGLCVYITVV